MEGQLESASPSMPWGQEKPELGLELEKDLLEMALERGLRVAVGLDLDWGPGEKTQTQGPGRAGRA